jgi:hypothetical protein
MAEGAYSAEPADQTRIEQRGAVVILIALVIAVWGLF